MTGKGKKAAVPKKKANGYKMPAPIATGEVIHDTTMKKKWRIGPSIGVGGFGEIYSACDHDSTPKGSDYPFVIKIEPHENGPLFVEKHFYIRNAKIDDIKAYMKSKKLSSLGMPTFFGHGSHEYKGEKYRYLVLERYGKDLWNLFKASGQTFPPATVFQIGLQMLEVLEYIHSRGYVHADLKGANILLGLKKGTENQAYLVDFGLATRVNDKEFKPDPKCAHNGTIEYTSRDAHLGVATMRGDLEILGYNMLQWVAGDLPWEKSLKQPKSVQAMKEAFMKTVKTSVAKHCPSAPDALVKFFEYVNSLKPKDLPDYTKCRQIFESYLKSEGVTRNSKLVFTATKKKTKPAKHVVSDGDESDDDAPLVPKKQAKENEDGKVVKRGRKPKAKEINTEEENGENEEPNEKDVQVKRKAKRKSSEPSFVVNSVKKTKLAPKATPPLKKNQVNTATQTSAGKTRRSPRQVSFDSPICEIIGEKTSKTKNKSANSSGDIFEDSFVIEDNKVKPKKKLLSTEKVTTTKEVRRKVTTIKPKGKSWKDAPSVTNGRSPPKKTA